MSVPQHVVQSTSEQRVREHTGIHAGINSAKSLLNQADEPQDVQSLL